MTEKDRELQIDAASLLMQRGVQFKLPALFFWDRLLGRNKVVVRPPLVYTVMEMCRVALAAELDTYIDNIAVVPTPAHLSAIARVVAIAICRDKRTIDRRAERLAKHIEMHVQAESLLTIYQAVMAMTGVKNFWMVTVSLKGVVEMTTAIRGKKENGS